VKLDVAVAIVLAVVLLRPTGATAWTRIQPRATAFIYRRLKPRLTFDSTGEIALVPIRVSLDVFAHSFGQWHVAAPGLLLRIDENSEGGYDLTWKGHPVRPLDDVEPSARAAMAAAIDLLHAVDELDDPSIAIAEASTQLREAVAELTRPAS
jgi:hypothetical protein